MRRELVDANQVMSAIAPVVVDARLVRVHGPAVQVDAGDRHLYVDGGYSADDVAILVPGRVRDAVDVAAVEDLAGLQQRSHRAAAAHLEAAIALHAVLAHPAPAQVGEVLVARALFTAGVAVLVVAGTAHRLTG